MRLKETRTKALPSSAASSTKSIEEPTMVDENQVPEGILPLCTSVVAQGTGVLIWMVVVVDGDGIWWWQHDATEDERKRVQL